MAKKLSNDLRQVGGPPAGATWVWLTTELLSSPAWRAVSLLGRRFIDFLLLEHLAHNGLENGNLAAPYDDLEQFGISRPHIAAAIREVEALQLVGVNRGGKRNQVEDHMSRYRLTWLAERRADSNGVYYVRAADDWKRTTDADVRRIKAERTRDRRAKNQKSGAQKVHWLGQQKVNSLG